VCACVCVREREREREREGARNRERERERERERLSRERQGERKRGRSGGGRRDSGREGTDGLFTFDERAFALAFALARSNAPLRSKRKTRGRENLTRRANDRVTRIDWRSGNLAGNHWRRRSDWRWLTGSRLNRLRRYVVAARHFARVSLHG